MNDNPSKMDEIRNAIDTIDAQLLKLFNERARCAIELGNIKEDAGLDIYDPERESQIVENMQSINAGPLDKRAVKDLFQRVIDESRRVEKLSATRILKTKENESKK